jgi:hypothetical protein
MRLNTLPSFTRAHCQCARNQQAQSIFHYHPAQISFIKESAARPRIEAQKNEGGRKGKGKKNVDLRNANEKKKPKKCANFRKCLVDFSTDAELAMGDLIRRDTKADGRPIGIFFCRPR